MVELPFANVLFVCGFPIRKHLYVRQHFMLGKSRDIMRTVRYKLNTTSVLHREVTSAQKYKLVYVTACDYVYMFLCEAQRAETKPPAAFDNYYVHNIIPNMNKEMQAQKKCLQM